MIEWNIKNNLFDFGDYLPGFQKYLECNLIKEEKCALEQLHKYQDFIVPSHIYCSCPKCSVRC